MLILQRLQHAIWVIIMEQRKLYLFVPVAHSWRSGHVHLGSFGAQSCIVVSSFLLPSPKIEEN